MAEFRTFPTKEIHLLRDSGDATHKSFTFEFRDMQGVDVSSSVSFCAMRADNPSQVPGNIISYTNGTVTLPTNGELGKVLIRVEYGDYQDILVVSVHGTVSQLIPAHSSFTVYKTYGRRLIALFAEFSNDIDGNGTIETEYADVTANSHLLSFLSSHSADVEVSDEGAVYCHSFNAAHTYSITIEGEYDQYDLTCFKPSIAFGVTVKDLDVEAHKPSIEVATNIEASGNETGRENVRLSYVFVPIGFSNSQGGPEKFEKICDDVIDYMREHAHLRYALGKTQFYRLNHFQQDNGVNTSFDLHEFDANYCQYTSLLLEIPSTEASYKEDQLQAFQTFGNYTSYKDSAIDSATNAGTKLLMKRTEITHHSIVHDNLIGKVVGPRRRNFAPAKKKEDNTDIGFYSFYTDMGELNELNIDDLFFYNVTGSPEGLLKKLFESIVQDNTEQGDLGWGNRINTSNEAVLCLIYNYDRSIGQHLRGDGVQGTINSSLGNRNRVRTEAFGNSGVLVRVVSDVSAESVVFEGSVITPQIVHEFLHAMQLGDEYETLRESAEDNVYKDLKDINFGNLQAKSRFVLPGGEIDLSKFKWHWPKVDYGAMITGKVKKVEGAGSSDLFRVPVAASDVVAWKKVQNVGRLAVRKKNPVVYNGDFNLFDYGGNPGQLLEIDSWDEVNPAIIIKDTDGGFAEFIEREYEDLSGTNTEKLTGFDFGDVIYTRLNTLVLKSLHIEDGGLLTGIEDGTTKIKVKTKNRLGKNVALAFLVEPDGNNGHKVVSVEWKDGQVIDNLQGTPIFDWSEHAGQPPTLTFDTENQYPGLRKVHVYKSGSGFTGEAVDLKFTDPLGKKDPRMIKGIPADIDNLVDNEGLRVKMPVNAVEVIAPPKILFSRLENGVELNYSFFIKNVDSAGAIAELIAFNFKGVNNNRWDRGGVLGDDAVEFKEDELVGVNPHLPVVNSPVRASYSVDLLFEDRSTRSYADSYRYPDVTTLQTTNVGSGYVLPKRPIVFYSELLNSFLFGYLDGEPGKVIRFEIVSRGPVSDAVDENEKYFFYPYNYSSSYEDHDYTKLFYEGLEDYSFQSTLDGQSNDFKWTSSYGYGSFRGPGADAYKTSKEVPSIAVRSKVGVLVTVVLEELEESQEKGKKRFLKSLDIVSSPNTYLYPTTGPLIMYSGIFGWDGEAPPFFEPVYTEVGGKSQIKEVEVLGLNSSKKIDFENGFIRFVGSHNSVAHPLGTLEIDGVKVEDMDSFHSKDYFSGIPLVDANDPMYQQNNGFSFAQGKGVRSVELGNVIKSDTDDGKWLRELTYKPIVEVIDPNDAKNKTAKAICEMFSDEALINPVIWAYIIENGVLNPDKPSDSEQKTVLFPLNDIRKKAKEMGLKIRGLGSKQNLVTALYEGGGTKIKGLYRTSINSVMRHHNESELLNYVSIYQLLNVLNPAAFSEMHGALEENFKGEVKIKKGK